MNPDNPNFRNIDDWADKCDQLGQQISSILAENAELKKQLEAKEIVISCSADLEERNKKLLEYNHNLAGALQDNNIEISMLKTNIEELKKERDELKLEYDKLEQDFKDVWDGRDQVIRERAQLNLKLTDAVTALEFYGNEKNWKDYINTRPGNTRTLIVNDAKDDRGSLARQTLLKLKGGG